MCIACCGGCNELNKDSQYVTPARKHDRLEYAISKRGFRSMEDVYVEAQAQLKRDIARQHFP